MKYFQKAIDKYIESCAYIVKKDKFLPTDNYRQKQNESACAALEAASVKEGLIIYLYRFSIVHVSFIGAVILRKNLPFEYMVSGKQMRSNLDYELREAKRQKAIDSSPIYHPSTFR